MIAKTRMIETAPGISLSVEVAGTGPLVILMHGWPELGLSFRHQIGSLAAAGYTVAVPDMRGYGASYRPSAIDAYSADRATDDMAAIAQALGAERWVAVGHDWGSQVAWRCAIRFPEAVAGIFSLSVPHTPSSPVSAEVGFDYMYPDCFYYVRYFRQVGRPEAELEADVHHSLKTIFFALSGDAPLDEWVKFRPRDARLLPDLTPPPAGPLSFMSDAELDRYAAAYRANGFTSSLNWYRNLDLYSAQGFGYPDERIRQPAGFLCGDREILLTMVPGGREILRAMCDDLRCEIIVPGAGHWIQQERPQIVADALSSFLAEVPFA